MRRIAVTGIGVVTPTGVGTTPCGTRSRTGAAGISAIEHFDASEYTTRFAGYVKDFDPSSVIDKKEARRMSRFQQFAMVAADEAMRDAGLTDIDEDTRAARGLHRRLGHRRSRHAWRSRSRSCSSADRVASARSSCR